MMNESGARRILGSEVRARVKVALAPARFPSADTSDSDVYGGKISGKGIVPAGKSRSAASRPATHINSGRQDAEAQAVRSICGCGSGWPGGTITGGES